MATWTKTSATVLLGGDLGSNGPMGAMESDGNMSRKILGVPSELPSDFRHSLVYVIRTVYAFYIHYVSVCINYRCKMDKIIV